MFNVHVEKQAVTYKISRETCARKWWLDGFYADSLQIFPPLAALKLIPQKPPQPETFFHQKQGPRRGRGTNLSETFGVRLF